jgi:hypothetical protein
MLPVGMLTVAYVGSAVGRFYFPTGDHWRDYAICVGSLATLVGILFEAITLRFYKKHTRHDSRPNV